MNLLNKVIKNSSIQLFSKAISIVLGVLTIGIMTRTLGTEGFGVYSTSVAFLQFFGIMIDFGLQLSMVNLMSDPNLDQEKVYSNTLTFRIISAVILFALAPLIILLLPYGKEVSTSVLLLTLNFFAITVQQIIIGLFQKKLEMGKVAITDFIGKFLTLAGIFYCSLNSLGLFTMLGFITIASLIQVITLFIFSQKIYRFKFDFDFIYWKKIISTSWPIAVSVIFSLIYFKADTIILSLTRTQSEVGIYAAPYRVLEILTQFPYLFVGIIFPLIAQAWNSGNKEDYKKWFQRGFDALIIAAIPLIGGTYILAERIMVAVAGEEFVTSGPLLRIIIIATSIIFINVIFGYSIVILGKQRQLIFGYFFTAILALSLYWIYIPIYGAIAAAIITIVSESLIFLINVVVSVRTSGFKPNLKVLWKSIGATLIMTLILKALIGFHLAILLVISLPIYLFVLIVLKGITKNQILTLLENKAND